MTSEWQEVLPGEQELAERLRQLVCPIEKQHETLEAQADVLHQMAGLHHKEGNEKKSSEHFTKASTLFNAALVRTNDTDKVDLFKEALFQIHSDFLKNFSCGSTKLDRKQWETNLQKNKDDLKTIREKLQTQCRPLRATLNDFKLNSPDKDTFERSIIREGSKVSHEVQQEMIKYFRMLWQQCINLFPIPDAGVNKKRSCKYRYSVLGLGSLTRQEVTPYSDLEFAILIEEDNLDVKEYLKTLTYFFNLLVLDLGETPVPNAAIASLNDFFTPGGDWYFDVITKSGFKLDGALPWACKTPVGRKRTDAKEALDLIKTPKQLADLQRSDNILGSSYHAADVLSNPYYLYGDINLYQAYTEAVKKCWKGDPAGTKRIRSNMESDYLKSFMFSNKMDHSTPKAKHDLYRFPSSFIDSLRMLLLPETIGASSWEFLNELEKKKMIAEDGAHNLKVLLALSFVFRLLAYFENESQQELLFIVKRQIGRESLFDWNQDVFIRHQMGCVTLQDFMHRKIVQKSHHDVLNLRDEKFKPICGMEFRACKGYAQIVNFQLHNMIELGKLPPVSCGASCRRPQVLKYMHERFNNEAEEYDYVQSLLQKEKECTCVRLLYKSLNIAKFSTQYGGNHISDLKKWKLSDQMTLFQKQDFENQVEKFCFIFELCHLACHQKGVEPNEAKEVQTIASNFMKEVQSSPMRVTMITPTDMTSMLQELVISLCDITKDYTLGLKMSKMSLEDHAKAVGKNPDYQSAIIHYEQGELYFSMKDYKEAGKKFNEAFSIWESLTFDQYQLSDFRRAVFTVAQNYVKAGMVEYATEILDYHIKWSQGKPDHNTSGKIRILVAFAECLCSQRKCKEALQSIDQAKQIIKNGNNSLYFDPEYLSDVAYNLFKMKMTAFSPSNLISFLLGIRKRDESEKAVQFYDDVTKNRNNGFAVVSQKQLLLLKIGYFCLYNKWTQECSLHTREAKYVDPSTSVSNNNNVEEVTAFVENLLVQFDKFHQAGKTETFILHVAENVCIAWAVKEKDFAVMYQIQPSLAKIWSKMQGESHCVLPWQKTLVKRCKKLVCPLEKQSKTLEDQADDLHQMAVLNLFEGIKRKSGEHFTKASTLLNAARVRTKNSQKVASCQEGLFQIHSDFLKNSIYGNTKLDRKQWETNLHRNKDELKTIRERLQTQCRPLRATLNEFKLNSPGKDTFERSIIREGSKVSHEVQQEMIKYSRMLWEQCINLFPIPETGVYSRKSYKYTILGLGSLASQEVTPYPDLEFAILIEDDDSEVKEYFKTLTYFFYLLVLDLGVTPVPSAAIGSLKDFSTPALDLIKTPKQLVDLQSRRNVSNNVAEALCNPCFLHGDENLYQTYTKRLYQLVMGNREAFKMRGKSSMESEYIKSFFFSNKTGQFPTKARNAIVPFSSTFINNLRWIFIPEIIGVSSWQFIDEMEVKRFIPKEGAHQLKFLLSLSFFFRLLACFDGDSEQEHQSKVKCGVKSEPSFDLNREVFARYKLGCITLQSIMSRKMVTRFYNIPNLLDESFNPISSEEFGACKGNAKITYLHLHNMIELGKLPPVSCGASCRRPKVLKYMHHEFNAPGEEYDYIMYLLRKGKQCACASLLKRPLRIAKFSLGYADNNSDLKGWKLSEEVKLFKKQNFGNQEEEFCSIFELCQLACLLRRVEPKEVKKVQTIASNFLREIQSSPMRVTMIPSTEMVSILQDHVNRLCKITKDYNEGLKMSAKSLEDHAKAVGKNPDYQLAALKYGHGELLMGNEEPVEAIRHYKEAFSLFESLPLEQYQMSDFRNAVLNVSNKYRHGGLLESAIELLEDHVTWSQDKPVYNPSDEVKIQVNLAECLADDGRHQDSVRVLNESKKIMMQGNNADFFGPKFVADVACNYAQSNVELNQYDQVSQAIPFFDNITAKQSFSCDGLMPQKWFLANRIGKCFEDRNPLIHSHYKSIADTIHVTVGDIEDLKGTMGICTNCTC